MGDASVETEADVMVPERTPPTRSSTRTGRRDYSLTAVLLIFLVPALGGCLFGYDIGATSYTIAQIISSSRQEESSSSQHDDWTAMVANSPAWQGFLVAAASLGAFGGSAWVQQVADELGRRNELRLGACLYAVGAIGQVAGGSVGTTQAVWTSWLGLVLFAAGRLVYGLGIGIVMHAAPTYLAEQCPSAVRGIVVCGKEAAIVLGILLGYIIGDYWTGGGDAPGNSWVYSYASSLVLIVNMMGLSFAIPRSCRWLLLKGEQEEALESLRFVYPEAGVAERELASLLRAQEEEAEEIDPPAEDTTDEPTEEEQGAIGDNVSTPLLAQPSSSIASSYAFLWDPRYRAPLVAGVGLVVLQQITGQPSVLSFATPIFQQAGLSSNSSVMVAAFKLVATLVSALTVERAGRKKLLYFGCSLMLLALVVLSFTISRATDDRSSFETALILLAMFLYIGGYQFSFGPITWLAISELFPLRVRGQAVAFAVQMNFFWNAVVQFGVPVLSNWIGLSTTFGIFAVLTMYR